MAKYIVIREPNISLDDLAAKLQKVGFSPTRRTISGLKTVLNNSLKIRTKKNRQVELGTIGFTTNTNRPRETRTPRA